MNQLDEQIEMARSVCIACNAWLDVLRKHLRARDENVGTGYFYAVQWYAAAAEVHAALLRLRLKSTVGRAALRTATSTTFLGSHEIFRRNPRAPFLGCMVRLRADSAPPGG